MALGQFAVGEYTMTYNAVATGMCTSGGKNLRWRFHEQPINDTDTFGRTKIDGIYHGVNALVTCTFKEWTPAVRSTFWPWSVPAAPVFDGKLGVIGQLGSDVAKVLVLTAVANTPAATIGANAPATLTAEKAKIAPENDTGFLMGPVERDIPIIFELLPYNAPPNTRVFALT